MNDITQIRYDYKRKSCSLLHNTIPSFSRLFVTELEPPELSEKMHSRLHLKSHKTETKAEVKNPTRKNLDIVPYSNDQEYPGYQNKWRKRSATDCMHLKLVKNAMWVKFEVP